MGDNNSAQEPTNFPVGNRDEVPSQSPEKAVPAETVPGKVVPNDNPEKDVADAAAAREDSDVSDETNKVGEGTPPAVDGAGTAGAGGDSIESPKTDPNRANAKPAADKAAAKLNK